MIGKKSMTNQNSVKGTVASGARSMLDRTAKSLGPPTKSSPPSRAIGRKISKPGKGTQPVNNPKPPPEPKTPAKPATAKRSAVRKK